MKKINKKVLFGVLAGVGAAIVGACCLCKKNADNGEYVDSDIPCDEETDIEEDVDSE